MSRVAVERWTPERRKERTREALLDAAAAVFAQRGFQGASLDEIAETAGYTRGAIYKHFTDKEDLLHAVCTRLNERTYAELDELPSTYAPFADFDPAEITAHWARSIERDREFRIVMLEFLLQAMRNPELAERAREFRRANGELLIDYIRQRAADAGEELPLPLEDFAMIFGVIGDGFAQAALVEPDVTALFGVVLDLIVRGVMHLRDESR
jgi:AcrR family transcriptional regulator